MPKLTRGFSLVELMVASLGVALMAGGTMAAYVTAIRISRSSGGDSQAALLAQDQIERGRNHIACDDAWFNAAACDGLAQTVTAGPMTYSFSDGPDSGADSDTTPDYYTMQVTVTF